MPAAKSTAPSLSITQNDAGDYFVGFDVDGTFVSIASVSANRVTQLQERGANLAELAAETDPASVARHAEAANALPYLSGASSAQSKDKASGGDEA